MNKRVLTAAVATMALWACGPDAMAVVDEGDVDGVETFDAELTSSSRSSTWFPMAEGNSWTFKSSTGETRTVTLTQVANGMGKLTGLHAEPTWVGIASASGTTMFQWNPGTSVWDPLVRFGFATTTWKTNTAFCSGFTGKRASTGLSYTTAAGTFTDTRTIGFEQNIGPTVRCAAPAFRELTFVPDVGLVTFRSGQDVRFNLVSAKINGVSIPAAAVSPITARVVLDKVNYESVPNTIRCITQPCASNAQTAQALVEFQLRNEGSTSQTYQFSTGCQFDVELVSATGRVVRKVSEGRMCTFALTSLTLGAGQSKVFSTKIPLEDRDGLQLSGWYTVRAKLIPSSNASSAPTASEKLNVTVLTP